MAATLISPHCPECGRLTVDNKQHCPEKTSSKWAQCCQWIICVKCKYTYGPVGFKGFAKPSM